MALGTNGASVMTSVSADRRGADPAEDLCSGSARPLFLTPCGPDLSPMEQVIAKLKHRLRDAQPRCRKTLRRSIGDTLGEFKPEECANELANAGYAST